jgi:CHAD domain-containing protein
MERMLQDLDVTRRRTGARSPPMTFRLHDDEPVGAGLERLAAEEVRTALEGLGAGDALDDDAVHEARKRGKRVRALLRLGATGMDSDRATAERRRVRDAGRALADLRDARILLDAVDDLTAPDGPVGVHALRGVREVLEGRHRAARSAALAPGGGRQVAADLLAGGLSALPWGLSEDLRPIEQGLRRAADRARAALRTAADEPTGEHLHDWRKRAKDLRHAVEALAVGWPAVLDPLAEALHVLTDLLGQHHDLGVLADIVADEAVPFDAPADRQAVLDVIEHRRAELAAEAFALGARVHAERPKALARRLRAYLEARDAALAHHGRE